MQRKNTLILKTFLLVSALSLIQGCAQKHEELDQLKASFAGFKSDASFSSRNVQILSASQLKAVTGETKISQEQLAQGLETQWGEVKAADFSEHFFKDTVIELASQHFNPSVNGHWPRYASLLSVLRNSSPGLEAVTAAYLKKAPQDAYILSLKGTLKVSAADLAPLADNTVLVVNRKILFENAQKLKLTSELSKQDKIVCDSLKGIPTEDSNAATLFESLETEVTVPPSPYLEILLVHGYVNGFDPHSYLLSEGSAKKMMSNSSKTVGIGASIQLSDEKNFVIVETYEGSPAELSGLQAGDIITAVDNTSTTDLSDIQALIKLVRGTVGSVVKLNIQRQGKDLTIEITRKEFQVSDVSISSKAHLTDAEFIKYSRYSPDSAQLLKKKLADAESIKKKLWILDLRGNPGGLVDEAVELVELLGQNIQSLSQRLVFYFSDGKDFMGPEYVNQKKTPIAPNLILLTNEASASASEITSGNIKALGNALIIGSRTYGKGSMQRIFPVNSKLRAGITQGIYFTGDHRTPQFTGVEPHFQTSKLREELQGIVAKNISLEADMPGAIPSPAGIAAAEEVSNAYPLTQKCLSDLAANNLLLTKAELQSAQGLTLGLEGMVAVKAQECMKLTGELKN
jgi:carboxyl-terminal processing protease